MAFSSKINTLINEAHANLPLETSFDSDLPQTRITDRRLQAFMTHILTIGLIQNIIFSVSLINVVLGFFLDQLELLYLIMLSSECAWGVVLIITILDFSLLIIRLLFIATGNRGLNIDELVLFNLLLCPTCIFCEFFY